MSDTANPYKSPETGVLAEKPLVSQGGLTETMLKHLKAASPWLRFIGIMGFIGSGCMIAAGLFSLGSMSITFGFLREALASFSGAFDSAAPLMFVYTLYFFGGGIITFFPALFTYRFGAKIKNYLLTNLDTELELAFKNNRSLWMFIGILAIIGIAAIPLLIIIVMFAVAAVLAVG